MARSGLEGGVSTLSVTGGGIGVPPPLLGLVWLLWEEERQRGWVRVQGPALAALRC